MLLALLEQKVEELVEQAEQVDATVYCSMQQERDNAPPRYDLRPQKQKETVAIKEPSRVAMAERMATEPARTFYCKRQQRVEPVFGIIQEILGFRHFHLRGLPKVETGWQPVYNFKRLFNLIRKESAKSIV